MSATEAGDGADGPGIAEGPERPGSDDRDPAAGASTRIDRAIDRVIGLPTWAQVAGAVLVVVLKSGLGPSIGFMGTLALAQNWRSPHASAVLAAPGDYILSSPVTAVLSGMVGATSFRGFISFHLLAAVVAFSSPWWFASVRRSATTRSWVTVVMVGGPMGALLLGQLGSVDPATVVGASTAVLARRRWLRTAGWALFAFNAALQAGLALVALIVVIYVGRGVVAARRTAIEAVIGGVVGAVAIQVLVTVWGGATSRLDWYLDADRSRYVDGFRHYWLLIAFSALGVGWLLLLDPRVRRHAWAVAALVVGAATALVVPFIALDQTRVAAILLWPLLLWVVSDGVTDLDEVDSRRMLRYLLPVAVLLPLLSVWGDAVVIPGLEQTWKTLDLVVRG